ncbi:hypothetical protein BHS06_09535 [Myxococcus xanthus]|uniref:hypothetical protein n=1 Tax=Myxococcus xanthus TaxID=34 RepID=UPI0011298746|nr:hypothetical protein [Myxococcus xanthus]QDE89177.1 hypothetical protein BHS06_09535 [Myxococcus xanthus]
MRFFPYCGELEAALDVGGRKDCSGGEVPVQRSTHPEEHPRHRHGGSVETNRPQLNPSMNFIESRKEDRRGGEQRRDDGEGAGDSQECRAREAP